MGSWEDVTSILELTGHKDVSSIRVNDRHP